VERSHQVGLMRDIYQSAERVIIFLSTEKCSGRGMAWLLKIYKHIPPLEDDLELEEEEDRFSKDADGDINILSHEDIINESVPTYELPLTRYQIYRLRSLNEGFTNGWLSIIFWNANGGKERGCSKSLSHRLSPRSFMVENLFLGLIYRLYWLISAVSRTPYSQIKTIFWSLMRNSILMDQRTVNTVVLLMDQQEAVVERPWPPSSSRSQAN